MLILSVEAYKLSLRRLKKYGKINLVLYRLILNVLQRIAFTFVSAHANLILILTLSMAEKPVYYHVATLNILYFCVRVKTKHRFVNNLHI